ncbi:hypothetical protein NP493_465g02004 [Ridgeia piscesae]|uniref:Protein zwilch n=1 Tax=Ridgeia piscesae TaxID=27915 RepID=A0AAD9NRB8_RIDPI|nr:hypothetical protein NP493_465g02004 [Ridgeia piscesae]
MKLRHFSVDSQESHESVRSPKIRSRHIEMRKPLSMKDTRLDFHYYFGGPMNHIDKVSDFKKILSEHGHRSGTKRVETQCMAEYNILESVSADMTQLTPTQKLLVVEASWKKVTSLLQPPPLDARSSVDFTAGLKDGLVNWAVENQDAPPLTKVKALLEELKLGDAAWRQKRDKQENDKEEELTSLKSLVLIHRRNKSQLGQFVRDSYYNKLVAPPLVDLLPLQLLVETGIGKLAADYSAALIGKELVTAGHLTYFVESDLDTVERVSRLYKLHLALELAVTLEQDLDVPRFNVGVAVRNALQYYETNPANECHTFTVSIPTSTVSPVFER